MGRLGSPTELDEHYDLVVIGAGISGLAAAYYYQQEHGKDARILIVDPHDDFGGHARRTEFTTSSGRKLIGHGGSQALDGPGSFSPLVLDTLEAIGVEYEKFYRYYDQDLYEGMGTAIYFDEEAWGTSHLTMQDKDAAKMFKDAPMAEAAKRDLATLMDSPPDYFPDLSDEEKKAALLDMSYLDFLTEHAKVHPDAVKYLFNVSSGWWSTGIDLFGCLEAWIAGYPGFKGMGLKWTAEPPHGVTATNASYWDYWLSGDIEPYIFHFPDGNHGVARAFVRQLIPEALAGTTMPDLVTEQLHYDQLDVDDHSTRIRLNSTAVHVEHDGSPDSAEQVRVAYSRNGSLEQVTAGAVDLRLLARGDPLHRGRPAAGAEGSAGPVVQAHEHLRERGAAELEALQGAGDLPDDDARVQEVARVLSGLPGEHGLLRVRIRSGGPDDRAVLGRSFGRRTSEHAEGGRRGGPSQDVGHDVRRLRTLDARSAGRRAGRRWLRPGDRHRGDHDQPLAPRLRLRVHATQRRVLARRTHADRGRISAVRSLRVRQLGSSPQSVGPRRDRTGAPSGAGGERGRVK